MLRLSQNSRGEFQLLWCLCWPASLVRSWRKSDTGPFTGTEWIQCLWAPQSSWRRFWEMMTSSQTEATCQYGKSIATSEDTATGLSLSKTFTGVDGKPCRLMVLPVESFAQKTLNVSLSSPISYIYLSFFLISNHKFATRGLSPNQEQNRFNIIISSSRNDKRWYNLRAVLNKQMLRPKDALQYGDTMGEVVTDFIRRIYFLRQRSPTGDVVTDLNNELYYFSLEGTLTFFISHWEN